jgi:hypothetical protein
MYGARGELFSPLEPTVVAARVDAEADGHAAIIQAVASGNDNGPQAAVRTQPPHRPRRARKGFGLR